MAPRPPKINADDEDDSDLADLLGGGTSSTPTAATHHGDPAVTSPASGSYAKQQERVYQNYYQRHGSMNCCDYISAYISVCCYYHPIFCSILAFVAGCFLLLLLVSLVLNPTEQFGLTADQAHFYATQIHSKYDLELHKVDHWCLGGGNDNCAYCEDPLVPLPRSEHASWTMAFKKNQKIVEQYVQDPLLNKELDVAFLGGSIVEEMAGRWMGSSRPEGNVTDSDNESDLAILGKSFRSNFQSLTNGVHGVALGVAGDASPNVLYRIMHGEMPNGFDPHVWWIHVGMNDIGRMRCSEEVTVIGILRIVEEILEQKPHARIVINSLFPMVSLRQGDYPVLSDYKDSFERPKGVVSRHVAPVQSDQEQNLRRMLRSDAADDGFLTTARRRTQEELSQASARDEAIRDRLAHRRHHDRERLNPVLLSDKTKIRKFRPGFLGKRRFPLWASIRQINKELHDFAANTPRVYYFDSTSVFASNADDGSDGVSRLRSDRISARGHPTELGYRMWESAVTSRLQQILDTMKVEEPDLFAIDDPPEEIPDWDDEFYDGLGPNIIWDDAQPYEDHSEGDDPSNDDDDDENDSETGGVDDDTADSEDDDESGNDDDDANNAEGADEGEDDDGNSGESDEAEVDDDDAADEDDDDNIGSDDDDENKDQSETSPGAADEADSIKNLAKGGAEANADDDRYTVDLEHRGDGQLVETSGNEPHGNIDEQPGAVESVSEVGINNDQLAHQENGPPNAELSDLITAGNDEDSTGRDDPGS